MEIPKEISAKYSLLKQGTYEQIGLDIQDPFQNLESIFS